MCVQNATKSLKEVTSQKHCVPLIIIIVALVSTPRQSFGGWIKGQWHRKWAEFLLQVSQSAANHAEFKGFM